jgi:hypothetical protein
MGLAAAGLMVVGCASDYGHGRGRYVGAEVGYNSYGPSDVWYDNYYGPYSDGYWQGSVFFYSDGHGHYNRDDGGHFRHERYDGSHQYRASPHHGD